MLANRSKTKSLVKFHTIYNAALSTLILLNVSNLIIRSQPNYKWIAWIYSYWGNHLWWKL